MGPRKTPEFQEDQRNFFFAPKKSTGVHCFHHDRNFI